VPHAELFKNSETFTMQRFLPAILCALTATAVIAAAPAPYDEKADAPADVQHALTAAHSDHRKVLLVFGANWCGDCRALDQALHGSSGPLIEGSFEVVKIDVGNFDKNLALDARYGHPIGNGIPAVVVVDAGDKILYSTKGGELANARKMGDQGIYDFLSAKLAPHPAG
jgi:thioredoxin 1